MTLPHHVVVCGPVSWNHLVYLDQLPEPRPHMQFALENYETVGGTSAGKALHLAGLGRQVTCVTAFGDDAHGARLRQILDAAGVTVVAPSARGASERHLNLMTRAGERVSLYLSTPEFAAPDESQFRDLTVDAAALVMDLSETSQALLPTASATGIPIWTDLHDYDGKSEFHTPFVEAADYIFMNADGLADPVEFMRSRVDAGTRAVICTLGAQGAMAFDADGLHRTDAVPVEIVDSNGAGDAFLSGYLHATLLGASTEDALDSAAAQATVALRTKHLHPLLDALL